ncbi:MAG: hypothetical protein Q9186_001307 [Xanthomendoza sp. 1 TL-2023]
MTTREASHAGSWYTDDGPTLSAQLQSWLDAVPTSINDIPSIPQPRARIIIAPHAGYSYSGPAAAYAYKCLDLSRCKRIFLLGPSHHLYLPTLALPSPSLQSYSTPLGALPLDIPTLNTLRSTNQFDTLDLDDDEAEHSLEMHLPYIHHLLSHSSSSSQTPPPPPTPLVPILIGSTNPSTERKYGALLSPYLADETNIFISSSDFCHWGLRFNYTFYIPSLSPSSSPLLPTNTTTIHGISLTKSQKTPPKNPYIYESIAHIDHACMNAISTGSHEAFLKVLRETGNTVCGRHPIGVVMAGLEVLRGRNELGEEGGKFRFVRYERSSDAKNVGDSSVSYASAFAVM